MKYLICNLKMSHTLQDMILYKKKLEDSFFSSLYLCPATCYLPLMHSKKYCLTAQNVSMPLKDTLTGSVSAPALKSLDVQAVLVGHSETLDTLEEKLAKIQTVIHYQMKAFVILSDTEEDYHYQYTFSKLLTQIEFLLNPISQIFYEQIIFIYEPSWVVGNSQPLDVQFIDNLFFQLKESLKQEFHFSFPLVYGGGLVLEQIQPFLFSQYIDGLLFGRASFEAENVIQLMNMTKNMSLFDKSVQN